jgi:tripartite-type tricarboxylate transporter receptor subunit TctC
MRHSVRAQTAISGRHSKVATCIAALLLSLPCAAQTLVWPAAGPIRYIVPFPPGGSTDLISRHVVEDLRVRLKQTIVVENVGGAGGTLGLSRLAKSKPDGYTIGFGNSSTHTINMHLTISPPYDPVLDFAPVAIINEYVNAVLVTPKLGVTDIKGLVALSKTRPGGLSYGSSGVGTSLHLSGELLTHMSGGRFVHVPYKAFPNIATDILGGRLDFTINTVEISVPFIKDGAMRALGTTGKTRSRMLPEVPTVGEGLPGYDMTGFMAVFAPPKTSSAIVGRLNSELVAILTAGEMRDKLLAQGFTPQASTPDELLQRIKSDSARWKTVIEAAGIPKDQ